MSVTQLIVARMKLSILFISVFAAFCNGQQRIAGGDLTTVNEFPFSSSLLRRVSAGVFSNACGGTIISSNAVLSAAACFFTENELDPEGWWRARVGTSQRNGGGVIYIVNRIVIHPNFDLNTLDSNIAVLRTRFEIAFSPGQIERVFIPGLAYTFVSQRTVQAIGWGADREGNMSDQLRMANIFLVDQQLCAGRYALEGVNLTSNMVCAGWLDVGVRGQCAGDEGSPLLDGNTVVGVYSHNLGCANLWLPAINTRVPPFARWIVATATA